MSSTTDLRTPVINNKDTPGTAKPAKRNTASRSGSKKTRVPLKTTTSSASDLPISTFQSLSEGRQDNLDMTVRGRKSSRSQTPQLSSAHQRQGATSTSVLPTIAGPEDASARITSGSGRDPSHVNRWNRMHGSTPILGLPAAQYNNSSDTERSSTTPMKVDLWDIPTADARDDTKAFASTRQQHFGSDKLSVDIARANEGAPGVGHFPCRPTLPSVAPTSGSGAGHLADHRSSVHPDIDTVAKGATSAVNRSPAPFAASFAAPTALPDSSTMPMPVEAMISSASPVIDPRILDQAVRTVLSERFGVNSLSQLPHPVAQSLLTGPLPQLIATYLQSGSLSGPPRSAPAASTTAADSETSSHGAKDGPLVTSPQHQPAPPIALLPASPAPFPADALPSEIQIEQNTNLYLNGLGDYVTDDELLRIGSQFGEVISHKAIINSETGLCKGYGFIMFAWAKDAAVAMVELQKRGYQTSFARHESFSAKLRMMSDVRSTNVYVSNLPLTMTDQQLEHLVAPHAIVSRRILSKVDGTSRGVGFIRFHTREVAQECIDRLHGKRLIGHPHPLQARFADSENQKRLKQDTSLRKVYADLDMGVLANHPASTSTRRSLSQTSLGNLARTVSRGANSTGMAMGRSDPGSLVAGAQPGSVGGIPMISPTSSLAGFYPGPIGAPPSPLWAAAALSNHNQQVFPHSGHSVWSPASTAFPIASTPTTPAAMPLPPYWAHKATSATGSNVQSNGTPSLSPSGSTSTLNSPAVSLDLLGQSGSTGTLNPPSGYTHLPMGNAAQISAAFSTNWALALSSGLDVERQLRELSIAAPQQSHHPFAFEQSSNGPLIKEGLQGFASASTIGNAAQVNDCPPPTLSSPADGLKTTGQAMSVSAAQTNMASFPVESAVYEANADDLQRLVPKETALQASQFVRASTEKAAIPIINPDTGRAWVGSNPLPPATSSDDQRPEIEDAKGQVLVTASASAPIVTVSSGGDAIAGGSSPTKRAPGNEGGEGSTSAMPSSNSAPALLSTIEQDPNPSAEVETSALPRPCATEVVE
ncbi:hypothetical protein BCV69DRAFT_108025 [Microstroma glucosiphilum]|uniref:RRM domain-containing protein n=1 Tax=Pseudomicrostroma glucosiphilum TaxID=1684307 RepID=A0A316UGP4_9BASI|nr:hypothetical protein BCV69DRAFT_108025 [Pseudomicrostroma glucosiphilum]PWN23103.1 hypothetical protein BCV69DRAFT_108025 [Pseudomicrostroma glucosiphilum]